MNEVGEYVVLDEDRFRQLVSGSLPPDDALYADLKAKHLITDTDSTAPIRLLALKYRTMKAFLEGFTKLHIFVVTLRCEHSCPYCQVSRVTQDRRRFDMSQHTAERALDFVFRSPADPLKIEFQGGEPLLNFERIAQIVEGAERRAAEQGRRVEFVVATNLALLTDEILQFLEGHSIYVSTSLDGPADLHNQNRPRPGGNSHALTVENIEKVRSTLGPQYVAALMTTTRASLGRARDIVDEYLARGFSSVFVRQMSLYGFAARGRQRLGYTVAEFLSFYDEVLDYALELNRSGTPFVEVFAQIVMSKILTPFGTGYVDLQSPAGLGIGAAVYNYDGLVYASDEGRMLAEMGDRRFALGSVDDGWDAVFRGERLRRIVAESIIESMPGCSDCAFQSYCGADPVYHHAAHGDLIGRRAESDFHRRNEHIIRRLLTLYEGDEDARLALSSWVTREAA